jgi:hypothetical protein
MATKTNRDKPAASGPEPTGPRTTSPLIPPPPGDHTLFLVVFTGVFVVTILCLVLGFVLDIVGKPGAEQYLTIAKVGAGAMAGLVGGTSLRSGTSPQKRPQREKDTP